MRIVVKDLALEVREYHIPDFSNWRDHDSFESEFAKLLRDLRATEKQNSEIAPHKMHEDFEVIGKIAVGLSIRELHRLRKAFDMAGGAN